MGASSIGAGGGGGAGGLRTSYNNSTTTTNSLSFPSGKTAIATYMLDNNANDISGNYNGTETNITYNTCLLYTSPSPRDRTRSRMPSSA